MTNNNHSLPQLPKGWVWTIVKNIGEIVTGTTPSKSKKEYYSADYPFYKPTDLNNGYYVRISQDGLSKQGLEQARLLPIKSILITCIGATIGKTGFIRVAGASNQQINAIIPAKQILPEFLYFMCISPQFQKSILDNASATTLPILNKSRFEELFLPLPSLPEQERIVVKLEELFTKLDVGVTALKKVKAELKRYRQSVLKSAFEGTLTEQWRKKNKLSENRILTTVSEVSDRIHYGYTASADENKVGPKLLRITDIQNNMVNWNSVPYCKIDNEVKKKYLLKEGDLVFARTGATVGKSYLITGKIPEAVFASYLIRLIIKDGIEKKYIYNFFQSADYWSQINKGKIGIGQPNVNAQILSNIKIPLVSYNEQHQIVSEIERRFSVVDEVEQAVEQGLKQSERLRQSILKKAFEGKLVPQDPNDPPAEQLLEQIKAEKVHPHTN